MKLLEKKELERAMYAFMDGINAGNILIVIDYDSETINALILDKNGNHKENISRYFMGVMIEREELEFVETLPKDVFSNMKNTWKKALHVVTN